MRMTSKASAVSSESLDLAAAVGVIGGKWKFPDHWPPLGRNEAVWRAPAASDRHSQQNSHIRTAGSGSRTESFNVTRYMTAPPTVEYKLTARGTALRPVRTESSFSAWIDLSNFPAVNTLGMEKMKLRKDRRHLYDSIEERQLTEDGDYIPKDFADWREIPSQALEQKELREALTERGVTSRKISDSADFAGCAAAQHQRDRENPWYFRSQREDKTLARTASDAGRISTRTRGCLEHWARIREIAGFVIEASYYPA